MVLTDVNEPEVRDHFLDFPPPSGGGNSSGEPHILPQPPIGESEFIPSSNPATVQSVQPPVSLGHIPSQGGVRRSARGWQPSAAALENLASIAREVDVMFAAVDSDLTSAPGGAT